jgi:hypothetical protein
MSGIIDGIVAKGLSEAWGMLTEAQRDKIRKGTIAGEEALVEFNDVTEDGQVTEEELGKVLTELLDAMGGAGGQALQAYLWSLFKKV